MSLRYALVGLLAEEPMSGYDLTKRFAVSLAHVWPAQHPQIYSELARLTDLGWIEKTGEGPRGRKIYRSTPAGITALREWLTATEPDRTLRHEPILRTFFRWTLSPTEAARQHRADADAYERKLVELQQLADSMDWHSSPDAQSGRLALEAGLRLYRLLQEWSLWAATRAGEEQAAEPGVLSTAQPAGTAT